MDASAGLAIALLAISLAGAPVEPLPEPARFRIEAPAWVLSDVPANRVVITALTPEGEVDATFAGQPLITGLRLALPTSGDVKLGHFEHGVLELSTDLTTGRKIYITESQIVVDPEGRQPVAQSIRLINRWWSVLPLCLAIGCAVWLKNAAVPMFLGVLTGAVIIAGGPIGGLRDTIETYLVGELFPVTTAAGGGDRTHIELILVTLFLAATAGVMSASGSIAAFTSRFERFSRNRTHGQLLICVSAIVGFFDATFNSLVRGAMLRPVSDRLQISREKLAFLIDATAGAVGSLVVVTTFIGLEYALVHDTYSRIGYHDGIFTTLFASIPYRFYPVYLFVTACMIAWIGNDFGPMRRAERRALTDGTLSRPESTKAFEAAELPSANGRRELLINCLIPLTTLVALIGIGLWWSGGTALDKAGNQGVMERTLLVLISSSPLRAMVFAAFTASAVSVLASVATRSLSLTESVAAWSNGARSMFQPLGILVLAWGFARVCDPNHLNTAGFIVEVAPAGISVNSIPALSFVVAAVVAFATGSSWTAAGILIPLFVTVTHTLLVGIEEASPNHYLMLGTIGGIFAGGLFGCHCSLLAPGTILASAGAGSDHYDHVATQTPYALLAGALSLLLGYSPAARGFSPGVLLPMGTLAIFLIVQFAGRSPSASDDPATPESESISFTAELDAVIAQSEQKKKRA